MSRISMRAARVVRSVVAASTALCVIGPLPTGSAALPLRRVPCDTMAVLPTFASDGIMFCASATRTLRGSGGTVNLYRSADRGRSWSGPFQVTGDGGPGLADAVFPSPNYRQDHTIFVGTYGGGYVTTDDGKTFNRISDVGNFSRSFATVFLDSNPTDAGTHPAVVAAGGVWPCCDNVYDPSTSPATRPVVPPPHYTVTYHYLVPTNFPAKRQAVVLGRANVPPSTGGVGPLTGHAKAFSCDAAFVCNREIYDFAPLPGERDTYIAFAGPTRPGSQDTYVLTTGDSDVSTLKMFRSKDSGLTWQPWDSVTRLLRGLPWGSEAHVAAAPGTSRTMYLRVSGFGFTTQPTPQEQLFRSDDDGAHWRRIGLAWGPEQKPRSRSTLPWNEDGRAYEPPIVGPGGALYVIGAKRTGSRTDYDGLYCSRDAGRSWTRGC